MINYDGDFKPTRKKEKKLYNVYKIENHYYNDWGEDATVKTFVGQTMAVSEKQAANNVAHRMGQTPTNIVPWWGDGCRTVQFIAEVAQSGDIGGYTPTDGKT